MKSSVGILVAQWIAITSLAHGFYPADGWWFNPDESGRGINIEMQDDTMFVSLFHYDESGDPVWWIASGQFDDTQQRFQSEFIATDDGQCPGCPWIGPDVVALPDPDVTIEFDSPLTATMTWAGGTTSLQRQYFAQFNVDDPRTFLLGEFHFTIGTNGDYSADWLTLDELGEIEEAQVALGTRRGTSLLAAGEYIDEEGVFAVLVEDSATDFRFYVFIMNKNRIEGLAWTFDQDAEPTGSGTQFIAHRTSSRSFVQTGVGPGPLENPDNPIQVMAAGSPEQSFGPKTSNASDDASRALLVARMRSLRSLADGLLD